MRRLLFALLAVMMGLSASAQNDSLQIAYSRIADLEQTITNQNNTINKLSSDVQSVLKMNTDLKNTLEIGRPKYKGNSGDMEYKVSSVNGNPDKNEVQVVIYAKNVGAKEISVDHLNPLIVDEKGVSHDKYGDFQMSMSGNDKQIANANIEYPAGVPFQILLTITGIKPETHFLNYIKLRQRFGDDVEFKNLTINWISEE